MRERFRGCLLGGAAGDALGYPVEFMSARQIEKRYGQVTDYLHEPALVSDDTQMTLFTAEGLLLVPGAPLTGIARCYRDWLDTQDPRPGYQPYGRLHAIPALHRCRAPGTTCLGALRSGQVGSIEAPLNDSKGCGGVMRVAPVGLYCAKRGTIREAGRLATEAAALTHGHELGYIPAAALACIVHAAIRQPERGLLRAVWVALAAVEELFPQAAHLGAFLALMDRAVGLAAGDMGDLEAVSALGEGWVGDEALAIAVYCALRHENDFAGALTVAVSHSGDSDSTGAVTGNILGAYLGTAGIPPRFLETLELRDTLVEMADALYDYEDI